MTAFAVLGDSTAIDLYPGLDAQRRLKAARTGLGAASLLFRNQDDLWPEFRGRDLATLRAGVERVDLSSDGATVSTVAVEQLPELQRRTVEWAFLSVGGNDLLMALSMAPRDLEGALGKIADRWTALARKVRELSGSLVVTTVYDPTDGTGNLPGVSGRLPIELLKQFNDKLRRAARELESPVADSHLHFLGHGVTAPATERWYLPEMMIEPSMRGASELRRLWLQAAGL